MMNISKDISFELQGDIALIKLNRASKRNALNDDLVSSIRSIFENLPGQAKVAVIHGEGEHFCAGLDLSEIKERDAPEGMLHSRSWHTALERVQYGPVPVIAALHGAVVGGGLELASACHIRVADETAFFALPEGTRGIFVGGGGSVRIPKLIGVARMTDMMMTGRVYQAADAERVGLSQYVVQAGTALEKSMELAHRIASNAPLTNYALIHALPRIAEQASDHGFLTEALMVSITQSAPEAKKRVRDFLAGKAAKVKAS
jgi:enoyl-CoA hydratase/carnithine racemase